MLGFLAVSSFLTAPLYHPHVLKVQAWVVVPSSQSVVRRDGSARPPLCHDCTRPQRFSLTPSIICNTKSSSRLASSATAVSTGAPTSSGDDEYEYVEYDTLTEEDFRKSEWLVGTNWDSRENEIVETWVRLAVDDKGQNVAIWGDDSQGKWTLDVASQFLSISKESVLFGKQIWACTTDDYYYLQGTVRGWNFFQAASVQGQWQAKRLGVDPEEAGTAPWFEAAEEESTAESD